MWEGGIPEALEQGELFMGMTGEGLWLGWKEHPCSLLQWEEAPELPETWVPASPAGLLLQGPCGGFSPHFLCVLQVPLMLFQTLDSRADNEGSSAVFHQGCWDAVITFVLPPPILSSSPLVTGKSEAAMAL